MKKKELQPYVEQGGYVTIVREVEDSEESFSGVPLQVSNEFLVIQEISEFYFYGYTLVPIRTIQSVHHDAQEKHIEYIMRVEGMMDKVTFKYPLDLTSWETVFRSLMEYKLPITLQATADEEEILFLGQVKRVDADAVWIHSIDTEGVLHDIWEDIPFDVISRVGFDEPYANYYLKHMRGLN